MPEEHANVDVLRFVVERPVQIRRETDLGPRLIRPFAADQSAFARELARAEDGDGRLAIVERHWDQLPRELGELATIARLDGWLAEREDSPTRETWRAQADKAFRSQAGQRRLAAERERAADGLLALTLVGQADSLAAESLVRALRIAELAAERATLDNDGVIPDVLQHGLVELPAGTLGITARTTAPDGEGGAVVAPRDRVDDDAAAGIPERLAAIDRALAGLRAVSARKRVTGRDAAPRGGGDAEHARPVWLFPKQEVVEILGVDEAAVAALGDAELIDAPAAIVELEASGAALARALVTPTSHRALRVGSTVLGSPNRAASNGWLGALPPLTLPEQIGAARVLGVGELRVVRQKLLGYRLGEVAHAENALRGELRERRHRRTDTREEILITEMERTEQHEQDSQSTERFELQHEASQTVHQDVQLEANIRVSGQYGPTVKVEAGAGYASNWAKDEATRTASRIAREITTRAAHNVRERVREERTVRTLTTVEESNLHRIDNSRGGDGHMRGLYRFVDKVGEAQTFIYDQRLLLELVVPDPASFYRWAAAADTPEGITIDRPPEPHVDPAAQNGLPTAVVEGRTRELQPGDLTPTNYMAWISLYKPSGVEPPPAYYRSIGFAMNKDAAGGRGPTYVTNAEKLAVPDGYFAKWYSVEALFDGPDKNRHDVLFAFTIGSRDWGQGGPKHIVSDWWLRWSGDLYMSPGSPVPIGIYADAISGYAATIVVHCERTGEAVAKWQIATYEQIIQAYFALKRAYDEQLRAARARVVTEVQGRNPIANRTIGRTELKKAAISMLSEQPLTGFDGYTRQPGEPPVIDVNAAEQLADRVLFFEQAFEWHNMQYVFYPYVWAPEEQWPELSQIEDADELFAHFLRSGAARVVLPVRPGWEQRVVNYAMDRSIPAGTTLDDVVHLSIDEEVREIQQGAGADGVPTGESWTVELPTTLIYLQDSEELPLAPAAAGGHP